MAKIGPSSNLGPVHNSTIGLNKAGPYLLPLFQLTGPITTGPLQAQVVDHILNRLIPSANLNTVHLYDSCGAQSAYSSMSLSNPENEWYMDSRATSHMTHNFGSSHEEGNNEM